MLNAIYASILIIFGFPVFFGLLSFITWQNGFRIFGWPYIARMITALVAMVWVLYGLSVTGWLP